MKITHISETNREKAKELIKQMTLSERARFHVGDGSWHVAGLERLGIKKVMITDGPHGLRKKIDVNKPSNAENTAVTTCFPTACATACSFDRDLLYEMGQALGEECLKEEVAVILGPAANIKRSPLCGRNFEYFSEDPYLTGEAAAALINGIQSKNVGTSLKHFLANNQETARLASDSVIDERALREIYLAGFEGAVKKSQPFTVMCSYNMINGVYAANNKRMLTDILRKEWGFEGYVMTDWGAMDDRIESIKSGLDLEMPMPCDEEYINEPAEAIKNGKLKIADLDSCIERVIAVSLQTMDNEKGEYDVEAHNELARKIARESAVLLKNDGLLPLSKTAKIAVIGDFAATPRYQGAGSSRIVPHKITSPLESIKNNGIEFTFAKGYSLENDEVDTDIIDEAIKACVDAEAVLVFAGLTDMYESEGFDREHMKLPKSHNALIDALIEIGKPVAVVLMTGSPVEMPWRDKVNSILLMNLSGQNVGSAVYDLVFGDYSPCGKLAETYPVRLEDTPAYSYFGNPGKVEYRESIYVGYRYYDKANRAVAYPFGHGLSYSEFEYGEISLRAERITDISTLYVETKIKNVGKMKAKEVVQLYVNAPESTVFRPVRELKGYEKVELEPGEEKTIKFVLDSRAFAYYNKDYRCWHVPTGTYKVEIGASSRDIRQSASVRIISTSDAVAPDYRRSAPVYYKLSKSGVQEFPIEYFAELFDDIEVLRERPLMPYDRNSTLRDLSEGGYHARKLAKQQIAEAREKMRLNGSDMLWNRMVESMILDMPLRSTIRTPRPLKKQELEGMIDYANGKTIRGKRKIKKAQRKSDKAE